MVNWIEKFSLENIRQLLEIMEAECYHELLLTAKNLRDLGSSLFPYIIPIVPRSLPAEDIKGEHFVLADLLKLVPSSSSQAVSAHEGQAGAAKETLVRPTCVTRLKVHGLPLGRQKRGKRRGQGKRRQPVPGWKIL